MSNDAEIIWKMEPHTEAKHIILRKYLNAWIPILHSKFQRINYIDGFAGPGIYQNGEEGSPIIAIKALTEHILLKNFDGKFNFLFIENCDERCEHLKKSVKKIKLPDKPKINIDVKPGKFEEIVNNLMERIDKENLTLAPTFVFIDPFGFSGVPLELIQKIMKNSRCEVLINFMYEDIIRWLGNECNEKHLNSLFGTDKWKEINERITDPKEKVIQFHNLYQTQLSSIGIKFIRSFEMKNKFNKTDYFLFFGTNNIKGLNAMKEAMWKVDDMGNFQFSDFTYNKERKIKGIQTVLFEKTPNYAILKHQLMENFKGKIVTIDEIEYFVISETAFLTKHIRKPILDIWENEKEPKIKIHFNGYRRKATYPKEAKIEFL